MTAPMIETERLTLRPLAANDLEPWIAFHADSETMRFLGGVQAREVAWRSLCAMAGAWMIRGFSMFAVVERASNQWIGRVGPWQPEGWPGTEVGWGIARSHAGKGFAYEAEAATIDYAVNVLGWNEVIHTIHPDNAASIRLAERLGAANTGRIALPPPLDGFTVDKWCQSASTWRAHRRC